MEKIKEQFDKVIVYSQRGIDNPKTEQLFERWEEAKRPFFKAFGNKYIYEVPEKVQFELTEEAKNDRISCFIDDVWNLGYRELSDFLMFQKPGFYKNSVINDFTMNDTKNTIIKKNTKLVKAFKYFVSDPNELEQLQIKASRLIQENKIEGTLCFSIHPLDYLSISENTHNWRSCHALDGEYRAGNLSYMTDQTTIVCYLKSDKDTKLPHFPEDVPWNNKKWRVLLYISNDGNMIFAGKQYPFSTNCGMKKLIELFNKSSEWSSWTDYKIKKLQNDIDIDFSYHNQTYIPLDNSLVSLYQLVKDGEGSKQFNDVLSSSCYEPVYCYRTYSSYWEDKKRIYANENTTRFEVGGMTYCLRCGKEEVVKCCDTMMCFGCELEYGDSVNDTFCFCECCGMRLETENSYYVSQHSYCKDCYEYETVECECCGDRVPKDEARYHEKDDAYYCDWCYNDKSQSISYIIDETDIKIDEADVFHLPF